MLTYGGLGLLALAGVLWLQGSSSSSGTTGGPPPSPPPPPPPPPPPVATTCSSKVTVCPWPNWCGSLWGIAQHVYGNGALWPKIYAANSAAIEAAAKAHGQPSSNGGNLIYTGTVLCIP